MFLSRYPNIDIGQTLPGSMVTDKIVDLTGKVGSGGPGSLMFVPPGFPAAGTLKLVAWPSGQFYTLDITADGSGTYDISNVAEESMQLLGGPEGFVYIGPGNPQVGVNSMLVSEYSAGKVGIYEIDSADNPKIDTRQDFITDLIHAEGAYVDPLTGDFLFSTFDSTTATVITVQGFVTPQSAIPDAFTFSVIDDADPGIVVVADPITVSGIETSILISIDGGEYSVNSATYTTEAGLVNNGDVITVQVTASNTAGETVSATLTLGAGANAKSETFTVTTVGGPPASTPDSTTTSSSGGGGIFGFPGILFTILLLLSGLLRNHHPHLDWE